MTFYTSPDSVAPEAITTGSAGALWFTDLANNSIGRITTAAGTATTKHNFAVPP